MVQSEMVMKRKYGFHLRPVVSFIHIVKKHECKVSLVYNEKTAPGNSLLELLKLGLEEDARFTLKVEGPDEDIVMELLRSELSCY
jgi:phosphotransferase system HPr (HPr) family protein